MPMIAFDCSLQSVTPHGFKPIKESASAKSSENCLEQTKSSREWLLCVGYKTA